MDAGTALPSLLLALTAGLLTAVVTSFAAYVLLGLAQRRYVVDSGLTQLAELSWGDIQTAVELGLRERGLSAVHSGREDSGPGAMDTLLSDGRQLHLMRLKHGAGLRVDDYTVFDLTTRRDVKHASRAWLVTTGQLQPSAAKIAAGSGIEVVSGAGLWSLVRDHLPPRLRERIANRQRRSLRRRVGLTVGLSVLVGILTFAATIQLQRALDARSQQQETIAAESPLAPAPVSVASEVTTPDDTSLDTNAAAVVTAEPPPQPAHAAAPLSAEALLERRGEIIRQIRQIPIVRSASWSTASTLVVAIPPSAGLDNDELFTEVCALLRNTEELRMSRVQVELLGADPGKMRTARWRQCQ